MRRARGDECGLEVSAREKRDASRDARLHWTVLGCLFDGDDASGVVALESIGVVGVTIGGAPGDVEVGAIRAEVGDDALPVVGLTPRIAAYDQGVQALERVWVSQSDDDGAETVDT